MKIQRVIARHFRGIKSVDWILSDSRFVCLVGPGDSTKTTLVDIISLVLSSRWNVQFTDADFYNCDIEKPIVLRIVVADLSQHLLRDDVLGMDLSGVSPSGELMHDPSEGADECVIIQLRVTETLEPVWSVVRPGDSDDGRPITSGLRERFGLFRVDERVDTHLRWGRGSALSRLTAERTGADTAVTAAHRAARKAVFDAPQSVLRQAADDVTAAAAAIGSSNYTKLQPGLDPTGGSSTSALLLHDDEIPLTRCGLGTRRLTSLAIQERAVTDGAIVLVDEVESGLEPHRLHHLLRHLKKRTDGGVGQVIMTTHSPVTVEALRASDLSVVRSKDGMTVVRQVPGDLDHVQGVMRAGPSTVLARAVIVCEGKTEVGVARRMLQHWDTIRSEVGKAPHATLGICLSDGQGSTKAPQRARILQELDYPTLLVIDNDDRASEQGVADAKAVGTEVLRWQIGFALEDEIVAALNLDGLTDFIELAAQIKGEESVRSAVCARLVGKQTLSGLDSKKWLDVVGSINTLKEAIAAAAKGKKLDGRTKEQGHAWFKQEERGESLGALLADRWHEIESSPLGVGLKQLYKFSYGEDYDNRGLPVVNGAT